MVVKSFCCVSEVTVTVNQYIEWEPVNGTAVAQRVEQVN